MAKGKSDRFESLCTNNMLEYYQSRKYVSGKRFVLMEGNNLKIKKGRS